ncbi:MAG: phosphotransferase family protein [Actinobacteria bacterium]|nr:phosphotransferase family protein [Actinomycetota bacterium]
MSSAADIITAWVEQRFPGTVTSLTRQPRWRPVWWVDVDTHDGPKRLCVRGDRVDMTLIFPLTHEMSLQDEMHRHGLPVPQVHGWIEDASCDLRAYVMDYAPGENDFRKCTDEVRDAVVDEYLQALATLHSLPVDSFAARGIMRAPSPAESGLLGMQQYERNWRAMKKVPNPFIEFALAWLKRNPPKSLGRESVIVWDSGQFHHDGTHLTAILDVEIGHIGDPMMDLAAWRQRDTVIGYGDFAKLYARYEQLSGAEVDLDALMRHHFFFCLSNELSVGPATRTPAPESDLMTNLQWCYETNLFATEALADILQVELPTVDAPHPHESRGEVVLDHLVRQLGSISVDDEFTRYQLRTMFRMARHAKRLDEIGNELSEQDLDDLTPLLGHRPESWLEGEAELEKFVLANASSGEFDLQLLHIFHKRHLRAQMTLGPAGSAMTHHASIQRFS